MSDKSVTTRISEQTAKMLSQTFDSTYEGLRFMSESFFVLRSKARSEIKGFFNKQELQAIVDISNGTIFDPKMAQKTVLKGNLEDSELYENTLTKWKVNKDELFKKIDSLSETQAFWIIFEAWAFWNSPLNTKDRNLEKFTERYA